MSRIKFPIKVLQPVKKHLEEKKDKLSKRKEELDKEDPFKDTSRVNDNAAIDQDAAEEAGHDRVSALRMEVDKALIRVRQTLTKIKLGKFGMCEKCGQLIDTDRLAVDPTVSLCIKCAEKK